VEVLLADLFDLANFIPRGVEATTGTMRIPGKADHVEIHSLGKGIPPPFQIIGPIKRPINPPITEAGKKSFLNMGIRPRKSVPKSNMALNTQKQYNNWVNIALDITKASLTRYTKNFPSKGLYIYKLDCINMQALKLNYQDAIETSSFL
jgi:hypothetical protein